MPILTDTDPDELISDPRVTRELNVSLMTLWRWDRDPEMAAIGWPARVQIRRRNYRSRAAFEQFKSAAVRRAIKTRNETSGSNLTLGALV
jgi:DNA topoisomerase IA